MRPTVVERWEALCCPPVPSPSSSPTSRVRRALGGAPKAMAIAVPRHYELLDDSITKHGGVRPVEQGEGDSVVGGVRPSVRRRRRRPRCPACLRRRTWPEGGPAAGAHGRPHRRSTAARRAQLLRPDRHPLRPHPLDRFGGQGLVSDARQRLVVAELPAGVARRPRGAPAQGSRPAGAGLAARPRGISRPPAAAFARRVRHNLPVHLTPLIGRRTESPTWRPGSATTGS